MPSTQGFAFGCTLGYYPSALRASEDDQKAAAGSRFGCGVPRYEKIQSVRQAIEQILLIWAASEAAEWINRVGNLPF